MTPSDKRRGGWQDWQREQRDDLTLSEARHILWERRSLVAGCTLLFVAVALLYGLSREPAYTAEAIVSVRSEEGEIGGIAESLDEILYELGSPEATEGFLGEAAARAGWKERPGEFRERLREERLNNGRIEVRFSGRTPGEAAQGANAYAQVFIERVRAFEGRLAGGTVSAEAQVEKAATPPEKSSGPGIFLVMVAAGAGGLFVGGIGALFFEGRARRWSGYKDAELTLRAPVLGVIPDYSDDLSDELPEEAISGREGGTG
ncbi:MAG: hypothetical protein AVDCRST_MAG14-232 [uncultured Rubrobacteraceae bacterium]|uniref:Polysaccharide chain length determinant N-terminal domain-containing protein n=1 Tax=uncultured Rubrobacteraceae bacterium TaxID=349277 RepID=A0A6J4QID9_9ACTN|nr:MAG: hypothetical protein AVDCRST_MAG14-232 [uncultured Rubrobacteraceae bacterium]